MEPILTVRFYRQLSGSEPVRDWLKTELNIDSRKIVGAEIKTVQFGWPIGMPLVRKLEAHLWEIRVRIEDGIVRIMFTVSGNELVLLHGFVKKSQKTPKEDLDLSRKRMKEVLS